MYLVHHTQPVKFNCTVVDDKHPQGILLEQWGDPPAAQRKPLTPMQPLVDVNGVTRFKKNGVVDALYEHGVKTGFGLNELHCMDFSDEDRMQFAQLIGYSLSGYGELSYVTDDAYEAAEQAAHGIKEKT